MFCPKCGNKVKDSAKFCNACGTVISVSNSSSSNKTETSQARSNYVSANNSSFDRTVDSWSKKIENATSNLSDKFKRNSKNNESSKILFDKVDIFTNSRDIDLSGIKREARNHPYSNLGGFLAFIVYGGYVSCVLCLLYALIAVIILFWALSAMSSSLFAQSSIYTGASFGIGVMIVYIVVLIPMCIFVFQTCTKIKNRELDFLQYYHKTSLIFAIFFTVVIVLAGVIQYCIYKNILLSYYSSSGSYTSSYAYSVDNILWTYFFAEYLIYAVVELIAFAIPVLILTIYFCKSARVRIYMGSDVYLKVSPWTRNIVISDPLINVFGGSNQNVSAFDSQSKTNNYDNSSNTSQNKSKSGFSTSPSENSNTQSYCKYCGNKLEGISKFCGKCGNKVSPN